MIASLETYFSTMHAGAEQEINTVIQGRIVSARHEPYMPSVLRGNDPTMAVFGTINSFSVGFFPKEQSNELDEFVERYKTPLPGVLPNPNASAPPHAFSYKRSKNNHIIDCTTQDFFLFADCTDSSALVENHRLRIGVTPPIDYSIPLLFIIFYGQVMTEENLPAILDELFTYAIEHWKRKHGK